MLSLKESQFFNQNFTLDEIQALEKRLAFFTIVSNPFIFHEVWHYKALIAKDWHFFNELLENEMGHPRLGPNVLHYLILNGNSDFMNLALKKLGEQTFANAFLKNSIVMQPVVMAIFSLNLDMVKWVYAWQTDQPRDRQCDLDPSLDILEQFHTANTQYSWKACLDWLMVNNNQMCTRLDVKTILSCLPDSKHLSFLSEYAAIFRENTLLSKLLLVTVQNKWMHILPWIENNSSILQQFLPETINHIIYQTWEAQCLDGLEFCYKFFKEQLLPIKQVYLMQLVSRTDCLHPNSASNIRLKKVESDIHPESILFASLIHSAGWEIAIKARHQNWEPFIKQYISVETAIGITKTMWSLGTLESIRFCYKHFKHHLFTTNSAGEISPLLDAQGIKETMLMRYWSGMAKADDPIYREPFLKSGSANSICCHNPRSLVPLMRMLPTYFLLREFNCQGELKQAFENKAARQPISLPNEINVQHSMYQIEQIIKRNKQIHKRYLKFLHICATIMFLKNEILIPELVFEIAQFMFKIEKIKPVFGFFKAYETQKHECEDNNALLSLQPDQAISLA